MQSFLLRFQSKTLYLTPGKPGQKTVQETMKLHKVFTSTISFENQNNPKHIHALSTVLQSLQILGGRFIFSAPACMCVCMCVWLSFPSKIDASEVDSNASVSDRNRAGFRYYPTSYKTSLSFVGGINHGYLWGRALGYVYHGQIGKILTFTLSYFVFNLGDK